MRESVQECQCCTVIVVYSAKNPKCEIYRECVCVGGGGRSSVLSKESLVKYIGSVCGGGGGGGSGMIVTILFYLALNGVVKLSPV